MGLSNIQSPFFARDADQHLMAMLGNVDGNQQGRRDRKRALLEGAAGVFERGARKKLEIDEEQRTTTIAVATTPLSRVAPSMTRGVSST